MYLPPKVILMYFLSKLIDFQRCQKTSLFRKFQMPARTIFAMKTIVIELDQLKFRI